MRTVRSKPPALTGVAGNWMPLPGTLIVPSLAMVPVKAHLLGLRTLEREGLVADLGGAGVGLDRERSGVGDQSGGMRRGGEEPHLDQQRGQQADDEQQRPSATSAPVFSVRSAPMRSVPLPWYVTPRAPARRTRDCPLRPTCRNGDFDATLRISFLESEGRSSQREGAPLNER